MTTFDPDLDPSFEPWPHWGRDDPPEEPPPAAREPALQLPTAEDLEALRQAAYEEGFAAGRTEGLQQGAEEVQAQAQRLTSLIAALARPLEQLDARVEEELVALAIALVRQLVRRELKTDPGMIVAAIQEAIAVLPAAAREIAVKVHPEDAALLREVYSGPAGAAGPGWRIVETPAVGRGGCIVVTSTAEVDATLERRLAAAIRHIFGGDRVSDAQADFAEGPDARPAADRSADATGEVAP